jgi:hypothetical protein
MFVERKVCYSALFTNLDGWHAVAVSFPLSDVSLAQLACPLSDIMFYLHSEITSNIGYTYGLIYFWFKRVPDQGPEQRESNLTVLCPLIIIYYIIINLYIMQWNSASL